MKWLDRFAFVNFSSPVYDIHVISPDYINLSEFCKENFRINLKHDFLPTNVKYLSFICKTEILGPKYPDFQQFLMFFGCVFTG